MAEKDVLALLPAAAEKAINAARESVELAKRARAGVRRDRINSRNLAVATIPPPAPIDMPDDWREDEDTQKISTDTNGNKKL